MWLRIGVPLAAFLSLFFFPWQVAMLLVFIAALLLPPAGIALGIVADLIYYVPGSAFLPYLSGIGLVATLLSLLVHRFVKTRIIE